MANTIQYEDMHGKRVPLIWNWFYLTYLCFLVGGLEPGGTSFNLGRTPVKFNGRNSSLDVGLAGSVGNSIFYPQSVQGVWC